MDRSIPNSNKILSKKWHDEDYKTHLKNIKNAKSLHFSQNTKTIKPRSDFKKNRNK